MRAGLLRLPFLLQSCRLVPDGNGGNLQEWSTIAPLWGALDTVHERPVEPRQRGASHRIVTRAREDVTFSAAQRLVHNVRVFQIIEARSDKPRSGEVTLYVAEQNYLN